MTVYAAYPWKSNAQLIRDGVVPLGYLNRKWPTLDPTWGRGRWWKLWTPVSLYRHDRYTLDGVDFRSLHYSDGTFKVVTYDPPYKLNGTASKTSDVDYQYGVQEWMSWQNRHALCKDGATEVARVLEVGGFLLWKMQDQVCGGHVRWQTVEFTNHATSLGLTLVDRFDLLTGGRTQPPRSRKDGKPSVQQHARRNGSTLLVFQKRKPRSPRAT